MSDVYSSATTAISVSYGTAPSADDWAGVSALTYTRVGKVEDAGEFGGEANVTDFTPLDTGVVEKVSGSINRGDMSLTIAASKGDAGQDTLATAFEGRGAIFVKIDMPDGAGGREVEYVKGLVTSFQRAIGTSDDVMKLNVNLALTAKFAQP